jgi:hypothetical protein
MNRIPTRAQDAPRFFCPGDLSPGAVRDLPSQAAHHAARVLRRSGDSVQLFNGDGAQWDAQIATIHKSSVAVRVGARFDRGVEPPVRIVLAQSISSRERMDFTLRKPWNWVSWRSGRWKRAAASFGCGKSVPAVRRALAESGNCCVRAMRTQSCPAGTARGSVCRLVGRARASPTLCE